MAGEGVVGAVSGGWAGDCAGVEASAAGSAGVAGAGEAWAGAAVVAEVPVGAGAAVGSRAPAVERVGLAALALAELLGSSLLVDGDFGVEAPPAPIAAANAVT